MRDLSPRRGPLKRSAIAVALAVLPISAIAIPTGYAATSGPASAYTAIELPAGFSPLKQNAAGLILGSVPSGTTDPTISKIYDPATGALTDISTVVGGGRFLANGISDLGVTVGQIWDAGTGVRPDLYERNADGSVVDIGALPGTTTLSRTTAVALNNAGQVVAANVGSGCTGSQVFVGTPGAMTNIGTLTSPSTTAAWSYAYAENNLGQVVGRSTPAGACLAGDTWNATIYSPSTGLRDLATAVGLPAPLPGNGSGAVSINDSGIAVGLYPSWYVWNTRIGLQSGMPHAVVFDTNKNTYRDLGVPNVTSQLVDINASGVVVGQSNNLAAVGSATGTGLTDLNTITTGLGGIPLASALFLDDAGRIVAYGYDAANLMHYFLLTPASAPVATVPAAPSGLSIGSATRSALTLKWSDNSTNEASFVIERCKGKGCTSFTKVATVAANTVTWTNTSLSSATTYTYRVKATNSTGSSTYSNSAAGTTLR